MKLADFSVSFKILKKENNLILILSTSTCICFIFFHLISNKHVLQISNQPSIRFPFSFWQFFSGISREKMPSEADFDIPLRHTGWIFCH